MSHFLTPKNPDTFFITHFPPQGALSVFTFHQSTEIFYSTHESTGWQRHMIPAQGTHSLEKQAGTRQPDSRNSRCQNFWALGYALPRLLPGNLLSAASSPVCLLEHLTFRDIFTVLSCICRNYSADLFFPFFKFPSESFSASDFSLLFNSIVRSVSYDY